jgi:tRNA (cytidine/uridine-2'-O-)-methyltransferase
VQSNWLNIVLFSPEIPGNTGSIGRTCLALNIRLILIKPYGFNLDEKAVRRAGLDYWKHLKLTEYENYTQFLTQESPESIFALSAKAEKSFYQTNIPKNSYLLFGPESSGLPEQMTKNLNTIKLPIDNPIIRSLNLSNAVTSCCYEAYRQLNLD